MRLVYGPPITLEKARKMPVGTVSRGRKKVADGKWVPVKKLRSRRYIPSSQFKPDQWAKTFNDPNVKPQDILSKLDPKVLDQINEVEKKLKGVVPTSAKYLTNGKKGAAAEYTPERTQLHKDIIGKILTPEKMKDALPPTGQKPSLTMLGGRGGSGKSWFKGNVYDPAGAVVLDADEVKAMLPEYEGWNAFEVHAESSDITEKMIAICKEAGLNLVIDATMRRTDDIVEQVKSFKDSGFKVECHYMHLPRQVSSVRAVNRFVEAGRYVPVEAVLGNTTNEQTFANVQPYLDGWTFFDNSSDPPPKLISKSKNIPARKLMKKSKSETVNRDHYAEENYDFYDMGPVVPKEEYAPDVLEFLGAVVLEKGRKPLPDGTIRVYNGLKYKKVAGNWEYLGEKSDKTISERKTTTQSSPQVAKQMVAPEDLHPGDVVELKLETKARYAVSKNAGDKPTTKTLTVRKVRKDQSGTTVAQLLGSKRRDGTNVSWFYRAGQLTSDKKDYTVIESKVTQTAPPTSKGPMDGLDPMDKAERDKIVAETTKRNRMSKGQTVRYNGSFHKGFRGQQGVLESISGNGFALVNFNGRIKSAAWRDLQAVGQINPHSIYSDVSEDKMFKASGPIKDSIDKTMNQKIGSSGMTYNDLCREFQKNGFQLIVVGGTMRDILKGEQSKDVDFITDATYNELQYTLKKINSKWQLGGNPKIGLVQFSDGGDDVDITPIHGFNTTLQSSVSSWSLAEDAKSRDLAMNTIQCDTLKGVVIDATGEGINDIQSKTMRFADPSTIKHELRYMLRAFKFIGRGYKATPETMKVLKDNLHLTTQLPPRTRGRFMINQIGEKDGLAGLRKFKQNFRNVDAKLWDNEYEAIWRNVIKRYGG